MQACPWIYGGWLLSCLECIATVEPLWSMCESSPFDLYFQFRLHYIHVSNSPSDNLHSFKRTAPWKWVHGYPTTTKNRNRTDQRDVYTLAETNLTAKYQIEGASRKRHYMGLEIGKQIVGSVVRSCAHMAFKLLLRFKVIFLSICFLNRNMSCTWKCGK